MGKFRNSFFYFYPSFSQCIPAHKLASVLEIGRFPGLHPPATLPPAYAQHDEDEDLWSEDDDQLFSQLEVGDGADNIKGSIVLSVLSNISIFMFV